MKKIAVLGASSALPRALIAALSATNWQGNIIDVDMHNDLVRLGPKPKNKEPQPKIKKVWYTANSPEVQRMSVKPWYCDACGCKVSVPYNYEPEGCCSGFECGCAGLAINPVFCRKCEERIFGPRVKKNA